MTLNDSENRRKLVDFTKMYIFLIQKDFYKQRADSIGHSVSHPSLHPKCQHKSNSNFSALELPPKPPFTLSPRLILLIQLIQLIHLIQLGREENLQET